jgi:hypothetical protein|tara:strand:- start:1143 stop:1583 length:441 start_codon:yes stop_codon:yes gene_type:complete
LIHISHRGNLDGPNAERENHPDYITAAYKLGYDVEVDVWKIGRDFFLGHDAPQYRVDWKFLTNSAFWCHAKNIEALSAMLNCGAHCFWHQQDDVVLTNRGFMWTYPGKDLSRMSVCVMPEQQDFKQDFSVSYGVCSDYIKRIKNER